MNDHAPGPPHLGPAVPRGPAPADRHLPVTTRLEMRILDLATDLAGPLALLARLGDWRR